MIKIAPSLLAADFSKLGEEIKDVEKAGADYLHIDVMDGHFVPNISFGFPIMDAIVNVTSLPMDVHLMIQNPDQYIDAFVNSGAEILTVHYEVCPHIHRTIEHIKSHGIKAGVAINPGTPVFVLDEVLHMVDLVLVMTVNPGFGGQTFIKQSTDKIQQLYQRKIDLQATFDIEVDGGINQETSHMCQQAGANILVAGSSIFRKKDRTQAIQNILAKNN